MDIQRLKFAWAHGARIQRDYKVIGYMGKGWKPSPKDDGWRDADPYLSHLGVIGAPETWRIHPDDEHLQYGPVSAALRDIAYQLARNGQRNAPHRAADNHDL